MESGKYMKLIDKFLKILKTDRNTFLTYILTLISIYICIDRLAEIFLIGATGISVSYWGPFQYTLAFACPIFAFYFSFASKYVTEDWIKLHFLYIYLVALYIIGVSMIIQWVNKIGWLVLFSVPNYSTIITNFMDLIKPAFSAFAWYLPICTFYPIVKWVIQTVHDTKDIRDSIFDYGGIDLSDQREGWGPYTCEMLLCKDKESGKIIKIPESRRFESSLVVGVSGSGKTSMIFEPMMARDIEKKYFLKEVSKEMGYTALRTGVAVLTSPYSNNYMNDNFSLNMLSPSYGKEKLFKAYFSKLIYNYSGENSLYKNLGITYLAPDYESISHVKDVANNFGIKYKLIDPNDSNSIGLNPFTFKDPIKTSIAISSVLKRMYDAEMEFKNSVPEAFMQNIATQAVENLTLLLKEVYPKLNQGSLPTLEDLLKLLNDFNLIEEMAEKAKAFPDFSQKYHIQLGYFKKTFYSGADGREETARYLQASAAQLENLLRYPGVRNILCNRTNNLNYDDALRNGDVILVCTRRGDLGASVHKAFGLFFLLLMQHSVLSRPGSEKTRIPHFLYIDEFPPFVCKATEDIFTLYRKYRVGTIISAQNLSQFGINDDYNYRQTILANCTTKVLFGSNTPDDNQWWQKEFGQHREWAYSSSYKTDKGEYDSTKMGIKWEWTDNAKAGKILSMGFKQIAFKTRDTRGRMIFGFAKVDFLETKYKEPQKIKTYTFGKFTNVVGTSEAENAKFTLKSINFNPDNAKNPNDINPVLNNTSPFDKKFNEDDNPIV